MKNIRTYCPTKYNSDDYQKVEENIYKTLYTSTNDYELLDDKELINTLKNLKDWKMNEDEMYQIEYESKSYYIFDIDYESGRMNDIYISCKPEEIYVTSLVFEPEPDLGENKPTDKIISQYPLEDILDKFYCFCTDFYDEENMSDPNNSYQEFASSKLENIRNLTTIIGKHVYNKEEDGFVDLIIE